MIFVDTQALPYRQRNAIYVNRISVFTTNADRFVLNVSKTNSSATFVSTPSVVHAMTLETACGARGRFVGIALRIARNVNAIAVKTACLNAPNVAR